MIEAAGINVEIEQILREYAVKTQQDPDQLVADADRLMREGAHPVVVGDSVLFLIPLRKENDAFAVHFYSAASPQKVAADAKNIFSQIKRFKKPMLFFGDTKDPQMIRLLRMIGANVLDSVLPQFTWMVRL